MQLALQWDRLDLRALSDQICFVYNIILNLKLVAK